MSPETVVRTWFEEVWNQGCEDAIDRLMAPDGVVHNLGPADVVGPEGFKQYYKTMRAALADIHIDVIQTLEEGDRALAHCRVRARHVGALPGAPASHVEVNFTGMALARVQNGQLVEGWNCFDFVTFYQQVGAFTPA